MTILVCRSILLVNYEKRTPQDTLTFPEAMAPPGPIGPFKLVTVNTAPDRAKRLIGRVVEDVKDKYTIIHSANAAGKHTGYTEHVLPRLTDRV